MVGTELGRRMVELQISKLFKCRRSNLICGSAKAVSAMSTKRANDLQAEDTLVATIELENGGLATLELTTAARPKDLEASITITGTKGLLQLEV